jgi:hypothetical protein
MSFNLFTTPTGQDLFGIDLYINSITGQVTNTRQNAIVRHNETNRFFVIPHSEPSKFGLSYPVNFLRGTTNYTSHLLLRAELAARPTANSGDLAFSVATTVTQDPPAGEPFNIVENTISRFEFSSTNFASTATFNTNTVCFVVTQMSQSVLELSRSSLAAGGDGSVPLTAQISYTVTASFASMTYAPRYLDTVVTIHTLPFPLTYQAPLSRDLTF